MKQPLMCKTEKKEYREEERKKVRNDQIKTTVRDESAHENPTAQHSGTGRTMEWDSLCLHLGVPVLGECGAFLLPL